MTTFVVLCFDRPDALEIRMAARPDHLAYLTAHPQIARLGGAFLDENGGPVGSMIILEVADRAAADAFCEADPYILAGVFERVEIRPWRLAIGAL